MSLPGHATAEQTALHAHRWAAHLSRGAFRRLGRTGLTVSRLGFGTYRCRQEVEEHQLSLEAALARGCNLIDTSANYTDGSAEALVGEVLNREVVWRGHPREGLVVVSKAGYIQGENMMLCREQEKAGRPFPEVVKLHEHLWHCIHPAFLEDQITRSLARMHLDTLDVYLLHNPEYFLEQALKEPFANRTEAHEEFYDRIRRAFIQLEKLVEQGLIRSYGISSNGFPRAPEEKVFVSLARVWRAYQDACLQRGLSTDQGHFAVIQLPFNWIEHGALTEPNNRVDGQAYTVLQLAARLNLGVLINRPLNALSPAGLLRLAHGRLLPEEDAAKNLQTALTRLEKQETELQNFIRRKNLGQPPGNPSESVDFQMGTKIRRLAGGKADLAHAGEMLSDYLPLLLKRAGRGLLQHCGRQDRSALENHLQELDQAYLSAAAACRTVLEVENFRQVQPLEESFNQTYPALAEKLSFSQKALQVAAGSPEISAVLNGMRTREYVQDSLDALKVEQEIATADLVRNGASSHRGA